MKKYDKKYGVGEEVSFIEDFSAKKESKKEKKEQTGIKFSRSCCLFGSILLNHQSVRVGKIGSFAFAPALAGAVGGQRQMCQCGMAVNFKFFCAVGKKLEHEAVGMRCRPVVCTILSRLLSVCISVQCVNVVLSSFRVAGNVFGLGVGGDFHHKC